MTASWPTSFFSHIGLEYVQKLTRCILLEQKFKYELNIDVANFIH